MVTLPRLRTCAELTALTEEIGFLPLFENELPGFSVRELTAPEAWWNEEKPEGDPWEWRARIAAAGRLAYGKFFRGRAGFLSRAWLPVFANFRRDGYDLVARWEEGLAKRREKRIMDLFPGGEIRAGYEIKPLAGFGREGEKGFEGTLTGLMEQTYLLMRGFTHKVNRLGAPYGWPVALYGTPEALFGAAAVRARYGEAPADSLGQAAARCARWSGRPEAETRRFLK